MATIYSVFLISSLSFLPSPSLQRGHPVQEPKEPAPCLTLQWYLQTMKEFPLQGMNLYRTSDRLPAGEVRRLDFSVQPPVLTLEGVEPLSLDQLCLMRRDLEQLMAYRIDVIQHNLDGMACVSFEEGLTHSSQFQKVIHNRGVEIRVYPFRRHEGVWKRVAAQSGFAREVFAFECGVRVGPPELLKAMDQLLSHSGHQLVRQDGVPASHPGFQRLTSIEIGNVRYWIGTGLALPDPQG
ncbi:MAG: hypothetical protein ACE5JX_18255 [Acidobacteriota bacterium]